MFVVAALRYYRSALGLGQDWQKQRGQNAEYS
jgi:hypothetical protein